MTPFIIATTSIVGAVFFTTLIYWWVDFCYNHNINFIGFLTPVIVILWLVVFIGLS